MKCWPYRDKECIGKGLGLLAVRVVVGAAFILHGRGKIQAPMNWMGEDASVPGILQALAAYSEFLGGIALILGFLTPLVALLIGGTMVGAIVLVHGPAGHPFVAKGLAHSYELAAVYISVMVALLFIGPGCFSLDWLLCGGFWSKKCDTGAEEKKVE